MSKSKLFLLIGTIVSIIVLGCGILGAFLSTSSSATNFLSGQPQTENVPVVNLDVPPPQPMLELTPTALPPALIAEADAEELLLVNLYERVGSSVVNIEVTLEESSNPFSPFDFSPPEEGEEDEETLPEDGQPFFSPQGQGSGFVYSDDGYIVTNNHVIEGATAVRVTFYNGIQYSAEVVGVDADSDLAVIKVDAPPELLIPVVWGDSDDLKVGQRVIAIGNPFGLNGTMTTGIVSALGRSLPSMNRSFRIPEIIQTDAAINPGNSGGPLLNSHGEVVGVNSAIVPRQVGLGERSFLGVGFAIPANLVKQVVESLVGEGFFQHPWVGIVGNSITPRIAEAMGLEEARGALIIDVLPGGPASKAGLQGGTQEFTNDEGLLTQIGGDVIIGVEGETVNTFDDIISFLSRRGRVNQTIMLTIIRDGEILEIPLTLEARPNQNELFRP